EGRARIDLDLCTLRDEPAVSIKGEAWELLVVGGRSDEPTPGDDFQHQVVRPHRVLDAAGASASGTGGGLGASRRSDEGEDRERRSHGTKGRLHHVASTPGSACWVPGPHRKLRSPHSSG